MRRSTTTLRVGFGLAFLFLLLLGYFFAGWPPSPPSTPPFSSAPLAPLSGPRRRQAASLLHVVEAEDEVDNGQDVPVWQYWAPKWAHQLPPESAAVRYAVLASHLPQNTGRYILFRNQDDYGGFNNKRERFVVSIVLAFLLNRTLVVEDWTVSKHESSTTQRLSLDTIWDMASVARVVPVVTREWFDGKNLKPVALPLEHGIPATLSDLVAVFSDPSTSPKAVIVELEWVYLDLAFVTTPQDNVLINNVVQFTLHYQNTLFEVAHSIAAAVRGDLPGLITMHIRAGDRHSLALADCSVLGLRQTEPLTPCFCQHAREDGVLLPLVPAQYLLLLWGAQPPGTPRSNVYVAANKPNGYVTQIQLRVLEAHGFVVHTFDTAVRLLSPSHRAAAEKLTGTQISCVEQIVCALGTTFVAQFPSSWDEWVIMMRSFMKRPGAKQDRVLLSEKAHCLRDVRLPEWWKPLPRAAHIFNQTKTETTL